MFRDIRGNVSYVQKVAKMVKQKSIETANQNLEELVGKHTIAYDTLAKQIEAQIKLLESFSKAKTYAEAVQPKAIHQQSKGKHCLLLKLAEGAVAGDAKLTSLDMQQFKKKLKDVMLPDGIEFSMTDIRPVSGKIVLVEFLSKHDRTKAEQEFTKHQKALAVSYPPQRF